MNPDHTKRLRQRIETMNKLRGRPLTNAEKLANLRRAFDEEDIMDNDHAKREMRSLDQRTGDLRSIVKCFVTTMSAEDERQLVECLERYMMNPDHAKRVLEHNRDTPVMVLAKYYTNTHNPSPAAIMRAEGAWKALVEAGYAIEPIKRSIP